jgi:hypothetical protein
MNMRSCVFIFLILIIEAGCNSDNFKTYKKLENKELASGKRDDSLFMGIYLGMASKNFYVHCWQLNKAGIFTDGENNTSVLYHLKNNELKYLASMNFYPDFKNGKIYKMRATFNYDAFAPWNKYTSSDFLLLDVLKLFKTWYPKGSPFMEIKDKNRGTIYVKVDGNRRITVGKYDDMRVKVDYTDLLIEKELSK